MNETWTRSFTFLFEGWENSIFSTEEQWGCCQPHTHSGCSLHYRGLTLQVQLFLAPSVCDLGSPSSRMTTVHRALALGGLVRLFVSDCSPQHKCHRHLPSVATSPGYRTTQQPLTNPAPCLICVSPTLPGSQTNEKNQSSKALTEYKENVKQCWRHHGRLVCCASCFRYHLLVTVWNRMKVF